MYSYSYLAGGVLKPSQIRAARRASQQERDYLMFVSSAHEQLKVRILELEKYEKSTHTHTKY